ncbi:uncharacterized protein LOC111396408 [Olea europaea var. sylvestris]|uniref:uncharacterized protein LOC111396408 n=1 Tax=Olea europaea var. sylvestris TaxID=158386 RepID=UPI000C1CCFEE|nr:uncharacterized protein LOC111396408 [Olea europaea var. sylvestris]
MRKDDSPLFKKLLDISDKILGTEHTHDAAVHKLSNWSYGGRFCNSAAYDFFRPRGTKLIWASSVWNTFVTPKRVFILWLATKSKLLTKDRLHYLQIDHNCCFCERMEETACHLFFNCPFTKSVWHIICAWVGIRRLMSTLPSALKWIKKESKGKSWHNKLKRIAFSSTVYHVWMARNRNIFYNLIPQIDSIFGYGSLDCFVGLYHFLFVLLEMLSVV